MEEERKIIHPSLQADPLTLKSRGFDKEALSMYAQHYVEALNQQDFYIASISCEDMYEVVASDLSKSGEIRYGTKLYTEIESVIRNEVKKIDSNINLNIGEQLETDLEVCREKFKSNRVQRTNINENSDEKPEPNS